MIELSSTPLIAVEFETIPSLNDFIEVASKSNRDAYGRYRNVRGSYTAEHRWEAKCAAGAALYELGKRGVKLALPLQRCLVVVRVWRKDLIRRDVHNLHIKPYLDGFTDAGLFKDDCETVMPQVLLSYEGLATPPKVRFEVHPL